MKYFIPILLMIFGCQPAIQYHDDLPQIPESNLLYTPTQDTWDLDNGSVKATLSANPQNGKLSLQLSLINNSSEDWFIRYEAAAIKDADGRLTTALSYGIKKVIIPANSRQLVSFSFEPINSMDFYRKIDYKGDLKERYDFPLACIQTEKGKSLSLASLSFSIAEEVYQKYLEKDGKEADIRIYEFNLSRDFLAGYRSGQEPEIRDEEIHRLGVHTRFRLWQFSDTLFSEWKITNQSQKVISIDPNQVFIQEQEETIYPLPITEGSLTDGKWLIRPGGKFQYTFGFIANRELHGPILSMEGLTFEKEDPLFYLDIGFRVDSAFFLGVR
jgi:hypothetical protein